MRRHQSHLVYEANRRGGLFTVTVPPFASRSAGKEVRLLTDRGLIGPYAIGGVARDTSEDDGRSI
jgi:hypothetical protein